MTRAGASTRAGTHPFARPMSTRRVRPRTPRANAQVRASTRAGTPEHAPPRVRTCAPLKGGTVQRAGQLGICWERRTRRQTKVERIQNPSSIVPNSDQSPLPHATIRATTSARGMARPVPRGERRCSTEHALGLWWELL